jgi:flagellar M-ring protein FliF
VTRQAPGSVKRLSVAVLLRDPDKTRRTAMEIGQITDLVKSAVGFDQARQDQVTVISRKFAETSADADGPAWYDNAWLPVLARNGTAILIALLVLLLGVRPLAKGLMKKREDATPALAGPGATPVGGETDGITVHEAVSLDRLEASQTVDDRIGAVRGFTRDNPARAALAIRDMIKADAK